LRWVQRMGMRRRRRRLEVGGWRLEVEKVWVMEWGDVWSAGDVCHEEKRDTGLNYR
jgi:hypothetical protein